MGMNKEDMLTKTEHDFLVTVAECQYLELDFRDTLKGNMGWTTEAPIRNNTYAVAQKLGIPHQGDFSLLLRAVAVEAMARGYKDQMYYFMWEPGEGIEPPPHRTPILPKKA